MNTKHAINFVTVNLWVDQKYFTSQLCLVIIIQSLCQWHTNTYELVVVDGWDVQRPISRVQLQCRSRKVVLQCKTYTLRLRGGWICTHEMKLLIIQLYCLWIMLLDHLIARCMGMQSKEVSSKSSKPMSKGKQLCIPDIYILSKRTKKSLVYNELSESRFFNERLHRDTNYLCISVHDFTYCIYTSSIRIIYYFCISDVCTTKKIFYIHVHLLNFLYILISCKSMAIPKRWKHSWRKFCCHLHTPKLTKPQWQSWKKR